MQIRRYSCLLALLLMAFSGTSLAQQIGLPHQTWSAEVIRDAGQPVIPLFDGWYPNADGSRTLCFGFFNMNRAEAFSIAEGESNYLSDERFSADLPTHFDPLPPAYRHVFCAFTVTVPETFGRDEKIYWHLSSNGQDLKVPGHILPAFVLDEPQSNGRGDIAPLVTIGENSARGRTGIHARDYYSGQVGERIELAATIDHADEEIWVGWAKHSGPGRVEFSAKEYITESGTETSTVARFSQAGEYIVRMQTIDDIAAFEFYCCHTNAYFHISVSEQ